MDGAAPAVSVVIATYNWSAVLRYAVASVLGQTRGDFELLVEGDGCTDDSAAVVASFRDPRIQWHNLPANSGSQAAPNNAGIARARGRFVAYLGHDDLWRADHLERLLDAAEETGADLVYSLAEVIHPGERLISGLSGEAGLAAGETIAPSSVLHRRDLTEKIGAWADPRTIGEQIDAELFARARRAGSRFHQVEALTVFKFPSSGRRNAYVERPCHEQADYSRRLLAEPDFVEREWAAIARGALARPLRPHRSPVPPANAPPGWIFEQIAQIRGLRPGLPAMEALPAPPAGGRRRSLRLRLRRAPAVAAPGEEFTARVELVNRTGRVLASAPPHPLHLSYHWIGDDGAIEVFDGLRSVLAQPLADGAAALADIVVRAPRTPGRRRLRLAAVQENVRWFDGEEACEASIDVRAAR